MINLTYKQLYAPHEYPLYYAEARKLCPTARYVGGVSHFLCECKHPQSCDGVQRMERMHRELQRDLDKTPFNIEYWRNYYNG